MFKIKSVLFMTISLLLSQESTPPSSLSNNSQQPSSFQTAPSEVHFTDCTKRQCSNQVLISHNMFISLIGLTTVASFATTTGH